MKLEEMTLSEIQLRNWKYMVKESHDFKWDRKYYVGALALACERIEKLENVAEAASAMIDKADPRHYGDLTAAEKVLADALEELEK